MKGKKNRWDKEKGELEEMPEEPDNLFKLEKMAEADMVFQRYMEWVKKSMSRRYGMKRRRIE